MCILDQMRIDMRVVSFVKPTNLIYLLDQGLPKGGHYSRSTTALVLWTLRVDTRSKGGLQEWFF